MSKQKRKDYMMKSEFDTEEFLAHHGVKGMKWGVRKDGKPQGYQGPKGVRTSRKTGTIKGEKANRHGIIAPGKSVAVNAIVTSKLGVAAYAPMVVKRKGIGTGKKSGTARLAEKGKDITNVRDVRGVRAANYIDITNKHRREMKKELKVFNSKWEGKDLKSPGKTRDQYLKEYAKLSQDKLRQITNDYFSGSRQSKNGIQVHVDYDPRSMKAPVMYATIEFASIQHSDDNSVRIPLPIQMNERGEIIDMDAKALFKLLSGSESKTDNNEVKHNEFDVDDFLAHHGIKGMKWGVRKDGKPQGYQGSSRTNRVARRDAKEYTKAKMFYGEGAGTRRKLIKAKVAERGAHDKDYRQAFDYHVSKTNMAKRSDGARRERFVADRKAGVKKTARGVRNIITSNPFGTVTIGSMAIVAAAKNPKVQAFVKKHASTGVNAVKNFIAENDIDTLDGILKKIIKHDDSFGDDFLVHHGIKGMKWGVRKDGKPQGYQWGREKNVTRQDIGGKNKKVTEKKAAKLDRKFEKKALSNKNYVTVYNRVAKQLDDYIPEINAKYSKYNFDGEDVNKPSPKYKQYLDDYKNKTNALLKEASASIIGTNASGTAHVEFAVSEAGTFPDMKIVYSDVKHASGNTRPTTIKLKWHKGKIVGLRFASNGDSTDEELLHHGIMGMKWGVRKDGKPRGYQGSKSGQTNSRSRSNTRSIKDLSNEELTHLVERLRLEAEYNRLVADLTISGTAQKVVKDILTNSAKQTGTQLLTAKSTQLGARLMGLKIRPRNKDK